MRDAGELEEEYIYFDGITDTKVEDLNVAVDRHPYAAGAISLIPEPENLVDGHLITGSRLYPEYQGKYLGDISKA